MSRIRWWPVASGQWPVAWVWRSSRSQPVCVRVTPSTMDGRLRPRVVGASALALPLVIEDARSALKEARDFGIIGDEAGVRVEAYVDLERQIGQVQV